MATIANRLTGLFDGFVSAASLGSRRAPSLSSLSLNDRDLADLNLPACYRNEIEASRARDAARYGSFR